MWIKETYRRSQDYYRRYHEYLGMNLGYSQAGSIKIDMVDYVENMFEFPSEYLVGAKVSTPFNEKIFTFDVKSPKYSKKNKELFQTVTVHGLFCL